MAEDLNGGFNFIDEEYHTSDKDSNTKIIDEDAQSKYYKNSEKADSIEKSNVEDSSEELFPN